MNPKTRSSTTLTFAVAGSLLLVLAVGVALALWRGDDEPSQAHSWSAAHARPSPADPLPGSAGAEDVHPRGTRRLSGVVRDDAGPVEGAEVLLYLSADAAGPKVSCSGNGEEALLLESRCDAALSLAASLVDQGRLEPVPLAAVRTASDGSFSFDAPAGSCDLLAEGKDGATGRALDVEPVEPGMDPLEISLGPAQLFHGTVQESGTAAVIAGAELFVATERPVRLFRTRSAADGSFSVKIDGSSEVTVLARAAEHAPQLSAQSPQEPAEVELFRPFRIEGHVLEQGHPAAQTEVELVESARHTVTDALGHFSFEGAACDLCTLNAHNERAVGSAEAAPPEHGVSVVELVLVEAGTLRVKVSDARTHELLADADVQASGEGVLSLESESPGVFAARRVQRGSYSISVSAPGYVRREVAALVDGKGETSLELSLKKGHELHGRVQDESGAPVAGANVVAVSESTAGAYEAADSDAGGGFTLTGLDDGSHRIGVEHGEYVSAEVFERLPQAGPLVITLKRASVLKVLVQDPAGNPLELAHVAVMVAGTRQGVFSGMSREDGVAHVERLPPGSYLARAVADGFAASPEMPVEVRAGSEETLTLSLRRGLTITGRVVDDRGAAVAGAGVYCGAVQLLGGRRHSRLEASPQTAHADAQGRFRLSGLEQGSYAVSADGNGAWSGDAVAAQAGDENVTLTVKRQGTVIGRVTEGGAPVHRFTVQEELVQSLAGTFRYTAQAGKQTLVVGGDFVPTSVQVSVEPGGETDVGEVRVQRGGQLEGAATRGGAPVVGLSVQARPLDTGKSTDSGEEFEVLAGMSDWTLADGRFRFEHLPPGRYRLTGHGPDGVVVPQEVQVQLGQVARVRLEVQQGGRLAGVVRGAQGEKLSRVRITIISDDVALTATTDREGVFLQEGLPAGRYRVAARFPGAQGGRIAFHEIEVRLGGETKVELVEDANQQAAAEPDDVP